MPRYRVVRSSWPRVHERGDRRSVVLDPIDAAVHVDGPAVAIHAVAGRFPHLAGAEPRVVEAVDQRLDHLAVPLASRGQEGVQDGADQVESLDPLRGPFGGDFRGGHAPDLLGVRLEEDLEQHAAEAVDDPVLEALLGADRPHPRLEIAEDHERRSPDPEVPEGVGRLERIVEESLVVVDPAEAVAYDQLVAEDLLPDPVHFLALREEAVAADVEAVAFILVGAADPADHRGVGLQDHASVPVPGELVSGREPGGASSGDDRLVGGDHGFVARGIDPLPAVRQDAGAERFRPRRFGAHAGLLNPCGACEQGTGGNSGDAAGLGARPGQRPIRQGCGVMAQFAAKVKPSRRPREGATADSWWGRSGRVGHRDAGISRRTCRRRSGRYPRRPRPLLAQCADPPSPGDGVVQGSYFG